MTDVPFPPASLGPASVAFCSHCRSGKRTRLNDRPQGPYVWRCEAHQGRLPSPRVSPERHTPARTDSLALRSERGAKKAFLLHPGSLGNIRRLLRDRGLLWNSLHLVYEFGGKAEQSHDILVCNADLGELRIKDFLWGGGPAIVLIHTYFPFWIHDGRTLRCPPLAARRQDQHVIYDTSKEFLFMHSTWRTELSHFLKRL